MAAKMRCTLCGQVLMLAATLTGISGLASEGQPTWNFESGDLRGWSASGNAFYYQPTFGPNVAARAGGLDIGFEGNYWIGTFEARRSAAEQAGRVAGEAPTGILTSIPFTIDNSYVTFLVGGGNSLSRLRVELLVKLRPGETPPPVLLLAGIGVRVPQADGDYMTVAHATGRNSEVMRREVWPVQSMRGRTARIRIIDQATGAWGHINVDDFQFTNAILGTRVRVSDEFGSVVSGAEVFVNGLLRGSTGGDGVLPVFPPLPRGASIVVRRRVYEHQTYRDRHREGSSQNWSYRVYNTSLPISNLGGAAPFMISNPAATQEVRLNRRNTLIGLHWVVSAEWDASSAEMSAFSANTIAQASQFLYNATDGQFFIEQVELRDDSVDWGHADVRIFGNSTLRANAHRGGFLFNHVFLGHTAMNQSRSNNPLVYVHEFGHSGLDCDDEYSDSDGSITCTAAVGMPVSPFFEFMPQTSCIMWLQGQASKLCSNHADNPHRTNTNQGGDSCWQRVRDRYSDPDSAGNPRWILQSPDTRGAILGMLPSPIEAWTPRVLIENRSRPGLLAPFDIYVVQRGVQILDRRLSFASTVRYPIGPADGSPVPNEEVWLHTTYGQSILMGKTGDNRNDTVTFGRVSITGAHAGDRLTAGGGAEITLTSRGLGATRDATFKAQNPPVKQPPEKPNPGKETKPQAAPEKKPNELVKPPAPAIVSRTAPELFVSVELSADPGKAILRVRSPLGVDQPPAALLSSVGEAKSVKIEMKPLPDGKTFEGILTGLVNGVIGNLTVTALDPAKRPLSRSIQFLVSGTEPKASFDIFSPSGDVVLNLPPGGYPSGMQVAIGPSLFDPPPLGESLVLCGPVNIGSSAGGLQKEATVRFRLPQLKGTVSQFEPGSIRVLQFDSKSNRWADLKYIFVRSPIDTVTTRTLQLGSFVVIANRKK